MKLHLISHKLCPYVQRAVILLREKGVDFQRTDIDLADKPAWFLEISPLGRVPVLVVDDTPIFESAVISEFLEETQPKPLHPSDPIARAHHRSWIEVGGTLFADSYVFTTTTDQATFDQRRNAMSEKLGRIEAELSEQGPFFSGSEFQLIDAAFAPFFRPFTLYDRIGDFGVFDGKPKTQAWRKALLDRPSVQAAVPSDFFELAEKRLRNLDSVLGKMMR